MPWLPEPISAKVDAEILPSVIVLFESTKMPRLPPPLNVPLEMHRLLIVEEVEEIPTALEPVLGLKVSPEEIRVPTVVAFTLIPVA
jgi:hypothetical protein